MNKKINPLLVISASFYFLAEISPAHAGSSCTITPKTTQITIPSQTLSAARNKAPGTKIGSEIKLVSSDLSTQSVSCTTTFPSSASRLMIFSLRLAPGRQETSIPGVFETNVPGIGVKVWTKWPSTKAITNELIYLHSHPNIISRSSIDEGFREIYMQLYVTGPVATGEITLGSLVEEWVTIDNGTVPNTTNGTAFAFLNINGSISFKAKACVTPDISVNLGKHSSSDFPNQYATSPTTPFIFSITDCDPGMNSVHYSFKPAPGITVGGTGANQHITLDSSSTARGFGIQVLYDSGAGNTLVPLNAKTQFTGYSTSATTTRSYTIPMKARFIRTASNAADVSGGSASSAIEFTMSYE